MLSFGHGRYRNNISAYIDGQLLQRESRVLEQHLADCDACRLEVEELRGVALSVRAMPEVKAPRSFRLSPDEVGEPAAAKPWRPEPLQRWRLAGAALAAVLALALAIDASDVRIHFGGDEGNQTAATQELAQDKAGAASTNPSAQLFGQTAATTPAGAEQDRAAPAPAAGEAPNAFSAQATQTPAPVAAASATGTTQARLASETPSTVDEALREIQTLANQAKQAPAPSEGGGSSTLRIIEFILAGVLAILAGGGLVVIVRQRG